MVVARHNAKIAQNCKNESTSFIKLFRGNNCTRKMMLDTVMQHKCAKHCECHSATSKNIIKMNVFEKENRNKCGQRNVLLRLKTESVLTQCTNVE